jgi:5-oxoprolinase (ATP-hydrolysing)
VDAYLTPLIKRYIENFSKGFDEHLTKNVRISFMRSDGGLAPVDRFRGSSSILSGPAGSPKPFPFPPPCIPLPLQRAFLTHS